MTAQDELARRIERDGICRAVQKKIDEGRADFTDTARYTDRAAELLGEVLAAYVPDMPPDERETLCKALLRQRYTDTNTMLNAVQRALDAAQGLHLAPQIADYPEERVEQAAHALADETVPMETIQRRAKSAPATIARSFHDDYIEKNASFRDSAGLKCYINRIAAGGCCKWCTAMAGRYRYCEEPEDVYRRHDNCSCTVTYESGRQRQDVWSKRTWEAPDKDAGASEPTVFTPEQARQIEAENGLTKGRSSGTMKSDSQDNTQHWFEKITAIDPSDKKAAAQLLQDFERQYANSQIEHCRVITVNGEVYDVHGGKWTVDTTLLGEKMRGSTNEHNHVTGESQYSFSWDDLRESIDDGSKTVIAFDEKYRYYMIFPETALSSDSVYDAYQEAKESVNYDLRDHPERIKVGDEQHERIKRACEKLGIKYKRNAK